MRRLLVCRIDQRLVKALRERAASNGRSVEAEHRAILEAAISGPPATCGFKTFLRAMPRAPQLRLRRSKDQLDRARAEASGRVFMRLAGTVQGPKDLSSRKGFSRA